MSFPASFIKLANDTWGVRLPATFGMEYKAGDTVAINTRAGGTKYVTLAEPQGVNRYKDSIWSVVPQAAAPQASQAVGDMGGILAIFDKAKGKLKRPAIVLAVPEADSVVRLTVAGPKAKVPGSITVTDNQNFVENDWGSESRDWLGRVTVEGSYQPSRSANGRTEAITKQLRRFAAEPARVAKESAALTGKCVFCNTRLGGDSPTAKKSLAVGYGQTCARNFGLPWGEDKLDITKPVVANLSDGTAEDEPFEPVGY